MKRLFFIFILIASYSCFSQYYTGQIEVLSYDMPSKNDAVKDIYQDKKGYMWFVISDKLIQFDGYDFKTPKIEVDDVNGISIKKIIEFDNKLIVLTPENGLYYLDKPTFSLKKYEFCDDSSITDSTVYDGIVFSDSSLILTTKKGVFRKDIKTKKVQKLLLNDERLNGIKGKPITRLFENNKKQLVIIQNDNKIFLPINDLKTNFDKIALNYQTVFKRNGIQKIIQRNSGVYWICAGGSIFKLGAKNKTNITNDEKIKYELMPMRVDKEEFKLNSHSMMDIVIGQKGNLWLASFNAGLSLYVNHLPNDMGAGFINQYTASLLLEHEKLQGVFDFLTDYRIRKLFVDNSGILWIVTVKNIILKVQVDEKEFYFFKKGPNQTKYRIQNRNISFPCITKDSSVWVGTWGGGLHHLTKEEAQTTNPRYKHIQILKEENDLRVFPIFEDSKENIWVGTNGQGLHFISKEEKNKQTPQIKHYKRYKSPTQNTLSNNTTWCIYEDTKQNIWVATSKGLNKYLPETDNFEVFFDSIDVNEIREDYLGNYWIGTKGHGLIYWKYESNTIKQYDMHYDFKKKKVKVGYIYGLEIDKDNIVWYTCGGSLHSLDPKNDTIPGIVNHEHTKQLNIQNILADEQNRLWLGTLKGLYYYKKDNNQLIRLNMNQGTVSSNFTQGCSKHVDGSLYFGTHNGFFKLYPQKTPLRPFIPKNYFTNITINNIPINDETLHQLRQTNRPDLDYTEGQDIEISFSSFDYKISREYEYEYKLDGVDDGWSILRTGQNKVRYPNLRSGNYTFSIRSVFQQTKGQSTTLHFSVSPPWYRSTLGYTLWIGILCFILYQIWKYQKTKDKKEKDLFQLKVEREKEEKLQKQKLDFFTNISHEIKTPLTLIQGPIQNILDSKLSEENRHYADLIKTNTERLVRLTNQLLDFRKVKLSQIDMKYDKVNITLLLRDIGHLFKDLANKNQIFFTFESDVSLLECDLDKDKFESIIFNLLTNAFKHTSKHGTIHIKLNAENDIDKTNFQLKIVDTGSGISVVNLKKIFDPFYSDDSQTVSQTIQKGTGVGLTLVKEWVKLMDGEINVSSEAGKGTCFTVSFSKEHVNFEVENIFEKWNTPAEIPATLENQKVVHNSDLPTILITEDDVNLNKYLALQFEGEYNILTAANGKEGFEIAKEHNPSLILTDIMMPICDGIEFCRLIKEDIGTSHIPVIILTAKTNDLDQLKSIENGADLYLTKPFSTKLLKANVANLLGQRTQLHEKFSKNLEVKPLGITITSVDETFMENIFQAVDKHLSDPDFSVEVLTKELGVSSAQAYRKIKALTNMAPKELIQDIRLKKAALLLKNSGENISEIAYKVGFNNPKYFSRSFSKKFNMTPRAYKNSKD